MCDYAYFFHCTIRKMVIQNGLLGLVDDGEMLLDQVSGGCSKDKESQ